MISVENNNVRIPTNSGFSQHVAGLNNIVGPKGISCADCTQCVTAMEMHAPIPYLTSRLKSIKTACIIGKAYLRGEVEMYVQCNPGKRKEFYYHIHGPIAEMTKQQ